MLYVQFISFCFSVSHATLEVLTTSADWLYLLSFLFCSLNQGLGPLHVFYKNIFFSPWYWLPLKCWQLCDWLPLEWIPEVHHGSLVREPRNSSKFSLLPCPSTVYISTALQSISAGTGRAWRGRPRFVSRLTSSGSHFVTLVLHCQV